VYRIIGYEASEAGAGAPKEVVLLAHLTGLGKISGINLPVIFGCRENIFGLRGTRIAWIYGAVAFY
jgi:hypothetical protein